jgi:serine/threonine protein kinase
MTHCLNPDCQKPRNADSAKTCRHCGAKLWLKDRYRAIATIGQGGFGRTFLAIDEDKPSKPRCVIKQFLPVGQNPRSIKKAADLFAQEAVRLEELGHHPQIPELLAYFHQDGQQYLIQEFIYGKNLEDVLAEQGALTEGQLRELLASLLPVLDFVHGHTVIHRDIKPGNILSATGGRGSMGLPQPGNPDWPGLQQAIATETAQGFRNGMGAAYRFSELLSFSLAQPPAELAVPLARRCQQVAAQFSHYANLPLAQRQYLLAETSRLLFEIRQTVDSPSHAPLGRLVLVDFGAAKSLKGQVPLQTGTTIGSPEYAAPEQARGKVVYASDLYSLGVTCVHLLTNVSPYDLFSPHENRWIWRHYLPAPISDRLGAILDRLLQPAIPQRYQSAAEVLLNLEGHAAASFAMPQARVAQPVAPLGQVLTPEENVRLVANGRAEVAPGAFPAIARQEASRRNPQPSNPPLVQPSFQIATRRAPGQLAIPGMGAAGQRVAPPPAASPAEPQPSSSDVPPAPAKKTRRKAEWHCFHSFENPGRIYAIALSPTQPLLTTTSSNSIKLWDLEQLQPLRSLSGHLDLVTAIALSPDGKLLVSGGADKLVCLWELPSGRKLATLALHSDTVLALALSPTQRLLASSSVYDPISLHDLNQQRQISPLTGHTARIDALAFSPDGTLLASGSGDMTIKLWDVAKGSELRSFSGHAHQITALAFSPDGTMLASSSWDGSVKLWNLKTRRHRTLEPNSGKINGLAFSPDGKKLAIAANDLHLWPLPSGKPLILEAAHSQGVTSVTFGQTADALISTGGDRRIKLWQFQ